MKKEFKSINIVKFYDKEMKKNVTTIDCHGDFKNKDEIIHDLYDVIDYLLNAEE